jgi:hypothetical protein
MASVGQQREPESNTNSVAALGLRRAALRGMLSSPLIEAEDQRELREELVSELQSVGQSMARIPSRNTIEVCAKLDALSEEFRPGSEGAAAQNLIASIRRDVTSLMPRPLSERSGMQTIRTLHASRSSEVPASAPSSETPPTPQAS